MIIFAAAVQMILVTMIDGRRVQINPEQVIRMSEANRTVEKEKQLAEGVKCVIFFTDKSYLSTADKCTDIISRWMNGKQP